MKIVFMGTPEFAIPSLEMLMNTEHSVVAVYTKPDQPTGRGQRLTPPPVKRIAEARGLPVLQPKSLRRPEEQARLASLHPDLIVVAAYGLLLPKAVLDIPPLGCLNVHPSLLPKYRGASPIVGAILAGEEVTGVTIMLMDPGMDTGPTLVQEPVAIEPNETAGALTFRLAKVAAELLEKTLPKWVGGEISPQPQDHQAATVTRPVTKEDGEIDWHLSAREIWWQVRAYHPWPNCYTRWRERLLKVLEAVPLVESSGAEPGTVVSLPKGGPTQVAVQTGHGLLGLISVQLEGKRPLLGEEFIRGQRGFIGSHLSLPASQGD